MISIFGAVARLRLWLREDAFFSVLLITSIGVFLGLDVLMPEAYETVKFTVLSLGVCAAIFIFLKRARLGTRLHSRGPWLWVASLMLCAAWPLLSLPWSWDQLGSLFGSYERLSSGWVFFVVWAACTYLASCLGTTRTRTLALGAVASGVVIAGYGLLQAFGFGYYEGLGGGFVLRSPSLLGNPNFSSLFLAAVLPLAAALWAEAPRRAAQYYFAGASVLSVLYLTAAASRGALLGAVVGLLALLVLSLLTVRKSERGWRMLLGSAAVLGLLVLLSVLTAPAVRSVAIETAALSQDQNVQSRLAVWDLATDAVLAHPVTGVGAGNFVLWYERHIPSTLVNIKQQFDDAHNLYLQTAATQGIPGLVFLLTILLVPLYLSSRRALRGDRFAAGLSAASVAWLVAAAFTPVPVSCYVLFSVLACASLSPEQEVVQAQKTPQLSPLLATSLLTAALLMFVYGVSLFSGETLRYVAQRKFAARDYPGAYRYALASRLVYPLSDTARYIELISGASIGKTPAELSARYIQLRRLHPESSRVALLSANAAFRMAVASGDGVVVDQVSNSLLSGLQFAPRSYLLHYFFAEDQLLQRHFAYAREAAKSATTFNPKLTEGWLVLAAAFQGENRREPATWAVRKALLLRPFDRSLKTAYAELLSDKPLSEIRIPLTIQLGSF